VGTVNSVITRFTVRHAEKRIISRSGISGFIPDFTVFHVSPEVISGVAQECPECEELLNPGAVAA